MAAMPMRGLCLLKDGRTDGRMNDCLRLSYLCSMDDDRARHLEDKAGGIVGGDMSSVH
jgi:hypothetical protein